MTSHSNLGSRPASKPGKLGPKPNHAVYLPPNEKNRPIPQKICAPLTDSVTGQYYGESFRLLDIAIFVEAAEQGRWIAKGHTV